MKIILGLLLCAVSSTSFAKSDAWQVQGFRFNLPAGFSRVHATDAFQLISTNGVALTVDAIPAEEHVAASEQIRKWVTYAEAELPQIATRHGSITAPLKRDVLPSGSILYTLAESASQSKGKHFGVFFVLISPEGDLVQMVFEGPGEPAEALSTFRPYVASAGWGS